MGGIVPEHAQPPIAHCFDQPRRVTARVEPGRDEHVESFPATCPRAAAGRMPRPVKRWYTSRNGVALIVGDNMITVIWPRTLRAGRTPVLASRLWSTDDPERAS